MSLVEIPKDILQVQLAKSLEVAERLYDTLVDKFKILDANRRDFPAGSPDQDFFTFDFTGTEYEGYLVLINLVGVSSNCTVSLFYEVQGNNFFANVTLTTFTNTSFNAFIKIVAYRGAKLRLRVVGVSPTEPAFVAQILSIKKLLPVVAP
jgi:hypothetical protein